MGWVTRIRNKMFTANTIIAHFSQTIAIINACMLMVMINCCDVMDVSHISRVVMIAAARQLNTRYYYTSSCINGPVINLRSSNEIGA